MTEDTDPIVQQLQNELEQARLEILRLRYYRPTFHIEAGAIANFLQQNYLAIAASVLLISLAFDCVSFITNIKKGRNNA